MIQELIEKRADLVNQQQELSNKKGEFSVDDQQRGEKLQEEFLKIDGRINALNQAKANQEYIDGVDNDETFQTFNRHQDDTKKAEASQKHFISYLKGEISENEYQSALSVGTDTAGGHLVPTELYKNIIIGAEKLSLMKQICNSQTVGANISLPLETSALSMVAVAEGAAFPNTDPAVAKINLKALKFGGATEVSRELLDDSAVNVIEYLKNGGVRAFAKLYDSEALAGAGGTTNNTGAFKTTAVGGTSLLGVTTAANNAIGYDDIVDLKHKLAPEYHQDAEFVLHYSLLPLILKLKSTTGVPLFQPNIALGTPDTILNHKVHFTTATDAFAAGKVIGMFGQFNEYASFGDTRAPEIEANTNVAWLKDSVTVRYITRFWFALRLAPAFVKLTVKA